MSHLFVLRTSPLHCSGLLSCFCSIKSAARHELPALHVRRVNELPAPTGKMVFFNHIPEHPHPHTQTHREIQRNEFSLAVANSPS